FREDAQPILRLADKRGRDESTFTSVGITPSRAGTRSTSQWWRSRTDADTIAAIIEVRQSSYPGFSEATTGIGPSDVASRLSLGSSRAASPLNQQAAVVELPGGDFARHGVLPHDVADAVVIEVAGRDHVLPRRRHVALGRKDLRVLHEPDRGDAVGI